MLLSLAACIGRQAGDVPGMPPIEPATSTAGAVTSTAAATAAPTNTTARTTVDLSPLPYAPGTGTGLKYIDNGNARAVLSGFSNENRIPLPNTWMGHAVRSLVGTAGEGYEDGFLTWAFIIPTVTEDGSLQYDKTNSVEPPYSRYWHSLAYTHTRVYADFLCYARETYYVEGSTDLADALNAVLSELPEPVIRLAALEDGTQCAYGSDGVWYDLTNGGTLPDFPRLSDADLEALPVFDLREETPLWVSDYLPGGDAAAAGART